ncbi:MAG: DUF5694 domain-containing protein [Bacteroidales bacterium]
MRILTILFCGLFSSAILSGQGINMPPQRKIMTLGVFHFAYPNLDVVRTEKNDQISVLEEPYQSEIKAVAKVIEEYNPTIIAVESTPDNQYKMDSLFMLYKSDKWILNQNEQYQLGFRIAKKLDLQKIYCVDDRGKHYDNIASMFNDSIRLSRFENYYLRSGDSIYKLPEPNAKVTGIIDALSELNNPDRIRDRLGIYLLNPFKYEEQPGDFAGVDFETGRWFNRNLRIFRNIQRIPQSADDRILLIIGSEHLNLLNILFDVSREYEFVSPLPYLEKARH